MIVLYNDTIENWVSSSVKSTSVCVLSTVKSSVDPFELFLTMTQISKLL